MKNAYDTIVLGSGGAGLIAALQLFEDGGDLLLVSKSPLGLNSCTTYAGGGFTYAGPGSDPQDHLLQTLEIGRSINDPDLTRIFAYEGPGAVSSLRRWGVSLREYERGGSVAQGSPIPGVGGMGLTMPLVRALRDHQLPVLENHMAVSILCDDSRVSGVQMVDLNTGKAELIKCKSVLIATGGGGRVYGRTNNPVGTTGDGYALGRELGLPFRDMEFVQFYPIGLNETDLPLWFIDLSIIDIAPLVDIDGTEFLKHYLISLGLTSGQQGNLYARDRASIAILKEYASNGTAMLHLEKLTAEQWQGQYLSSVLRLNRPGIYDFTKKPVKVKPLQHYMSGGLVIDCDGSTEVPGVYACGEVTGGVDGANRIGGNALTNISLFGLRAAKAAMQYNREHEFSQQKANPGMSLDDLYKNSCGDQPSVLRQKLQDTMDMYLSPLRDEAGIKTALQIIADLISQQPRLKISNRSDLREALELHSLLDTAELVAQAALTRRESRGVHFRLDYPLEDPELAKPVFIR